MVDIRFVSDTRFLKNADFILSKNMLDAIYSEP